LADRTSGTETFPNPRRLAQTHLRENLIAFNGLRQVAPNQSRTERRLKPNRAVELQPRQQLAVRDGRGRDRTAQAVDRAGEVRACWRSRTRVLETWKPGELRLGGDGGQHARFSGFQIPRLCGSRPDPVGARREPTVDFAERPRSGLPRMDAGSAALRIAMAISLAQDFHCCKRDESSVLGRLNAFRPICGCARDAGSIPPLNA